MIVGAEVDFGFFSDSLGLVDNLDRLLNNSSFPVDFLDLEDFADLADNLLRLEIASSPPSNSKLPPSFSPLMLLTPLLLSLKGFLFGLFDLFDFPDF